MSWLKSFCTALYKSSYDLEWLQQRATFLKQAWGYFFSFVFLLTIVTLVPLFWSLPQFVRQVRQVVNESVPSFTAHIKAGRLQIEELEQPYIYKSPEENDSFFVYVDTVATDTPTIGDVLKQHGRSGILVTQDAVQIYDNGQGRFFDFRSFREGTWTKADMVNLLNRLSVPVLILGIFLIMIIFFIGGVVGKLFAGAIIVFLVWLVARMMKRPWMYGELFVVSLYALTLPSVLLLVEQWVSISIPWLYTIALLIIMGLVVWHKKPKEEAERK